MAVKHYSHQFGMIRHAGIFIVHNEVIVDVNISPLFPED